MPMCHMPMCHMSMCHMSMCHMPMCLPSSPHTHCATYALHHPRTAPHTHCYAYCAYLHTYHRPPRVHTDDFSAGGGVGSGGEVAFFFFLTSSSSCRSCRHAVRIGHCELDAAAHLMRMHVCIRGRACTCVHVCMCACAYVPNVCACVHV